MYKMISNAPSLRKSLDWKKILKETTRIPLFDLGIIQWSAIKELHILENVILEENDSPVLDDELTTNINGCYINSDRTWLLVLGVELQDVIVYLAQCSSKLTCLDIRYTLITHLDLSGTLGIRQLSLSDNKNLHSVKGLELLRKLTILDLKRTAISRIPDLDLFPGLYSLSIRETPIETVVIKSKLNNLKYFDAAKSLITQCDFLDKLPSLQTLSLSYTRINSLPLIGELTNLEILSISNTKITTVPDVSGLNKLRTLNMCDTAISTLENVALPKSIRNLYISGTQIKNIPESIVELKNLRRLNLSNMELDTLSQGLLQLSLEFVTDNRFGINISDTYVKNIDMSIFSQSRTVIEAWFNARIYKPDNPCTLNEIKVVFLGDGGAGKSLTIQRLLSDGIIPKNFDGHSTPGIAITSRHYNVGSSRVLIHIWDFGGQEILHSMHRMFLTKRTFYVVLINSRDNTQDERARYWLHNIKSFANGSPVLLVLNQIDQNPSASVNEASLRELYPQLSTIVRMSAKDYTEEDFKEAFEKVLFRELSQMPYIAEPFLQSWNQLKNKLQNMEKNYIDADEFEKMCEECGVETSRDIRSNLLDWFSDLGVSFCYRDNLALSNYMVLRPDWITNAIYIILFNGSDKVKNGLIKHEDIYRMLKRPENGEVLARSVLSGISYSSIETEYVLGVIRKFRLSYRIDDDTEFIPSLCDRNEKAIASEFINGNGVLEFHMEFKYLPNNVLHRLMVEMRNHLDTNNVWLTGAIFSFDAMGVSALVKTEDNILKIFAKSENGLYPANTYLSLIKSTIESINESIGLSATESIVYKDGGINELFEYDYLIESYAHGNLTVYSRSFRTNIKILDILNQSDSRVNERRSRLLRDIVDSCITMQNNKLYWRVSEDARNTFIRDMLRSKGYYISDQTFGGKSQTGKSAGELDIEIRESARRPLAIYEAMNLKGFSQSDKEYWNKHLLKLIDNYNPSGLPFLFLVTYLECTKDDFKELWLNYSVHFSQYSCENYSLQRVINKEDETFYLRSAECVYDRAGLPTTVYHICVRLGE